MKKLIHKNFLTNTTIFFGLTIFAMSIIVWTLQAVNYFDFVTEDGHGLNIYFYYTALNFPKIIHRILPFVFFISLFLTIIKYEKNNELNIFWINGVSKVNFTHNILIFSFLIMILQISLGSIISPISQLKARNYLKNSDINFFTSLIKEGKFINIVKDLTIFIEKKEDDQVYSNIFLDDSTKANSRIIYAKKGKIINDGKEKKFRLYDGKVINKDKLKINIFNFQQIDFDLSNFTSNTIIVPKIQEIDSITLLSCFTKFTFKEYSAFKCSDDLLNNIKQELLKRFHQPLYIPIISMLCCYLVIYSNNNLKYNFMVRLIFFIILMIIILSEAALRYSFKSNLSLLSYIILPIIILFICYTIFYRTVKNV
ncbi:LptF/LptG family permease [Candidatus Pelagibacter sp.]|nr:LptF/LptG family permease [Candidatus Pelagibacter sp.]